MALPGVGTIAPGSVLRLARCAWIGSEPIRGLFDRVAQRVRSAAQTRTHGLDHVLPGCVAASYECRTRLKIPKSSLNFCPAAQRLRVAAERASAPFLPEICRSTDAHTTRTAMKIRGRERSVFHPAPPS